ncbi:MAG: phenylalanine--tRNA ligase subunit beta [Litoricola sp.]|jgi:phenylalanyl-tRNA synthetase beta chain|nr:phenylalanine--tRNA ligase subunit beta [Litorivicinus sp.]MBL6809732.1 phenylalanine--tRNA ligase subunit beta [Litorivicinus sp.]MDA0893415.1 phenylalanine--tRNA ligase subunit beta [Pseudomonadota bacterium]MDB2402507.1 phenylalanine--tRNA ligase subunit beta [Litorivicinaceae bacterium]HAB77505.1 phenylalanine--tRNA ligase subunit beta [Gammaproteobacteria bacterium]
MKASISWLKSLCPTDLSIDDIVRRLTMAGLEVDGVEPASKPWTHVVVGEVLSVTQHPDADKLNVCEVTDGESTYQVVCGATNVRAGLKVPFARVGAVIGDDFRIQQAKLRGVDSHGMLCGADELGLSDERDGLMELPDHVVTGSDVADLLSLPDHVVEVDLTPNRGDCLSITGLARELGVLSQTTVRTVDCEAVDPESDETHDVHLSAPEGCPCYVGRVIEHVDVTKPTPMWMVERLRRSGIRSIDAIVDITNYVMLELGQPMHAFDRDQLVGEIDVRMAHPGEQLVLLDGKTLTLSDDVLVIADQEKALALAGIMGGEHSGISERTTTVFLESAYFDPITIAGKARRYGLHTDASARFERGVDWQLAERACQRATALILDICGGVPGPVMITDNEQALPTLQVVTLTHARIKQQLKIELASETIQQMLQALGFDVDVTSDGFRCVAPSWRFDIAIEQDLIEEIARIYGYNNLPTSLPAQALTMAAVPEAETPLMRLKHYLVDQDVQEAVTYSFVDPAMQALLGDGVQGVRLANPIASNLAEMRRSLMPGLVEAVRHNVNRQAPRVRVFETGQCFVSSGDQLDQSERLGIALYGQQAPLHFSGDRLVDFFDLKGIVDGLGMVNGGGSLSWSSGEHPALAPGQTARVSMNGQSIGIVGRLHPRLARELDLPKPLFLADLNLSPLLSGQVTAFKAISRYPRVLRDLAVVVDDSIAWQQIVDAVESLGDSRIQSVELFDVYRGTGVPEGCQSLALSLSLQDPEKTLDDVAIQEMVDQVVRTLGEQTGAELRG